MRRNEQIPKKIRNFANSKPKRPCSSRNSRAGNQDLFSGPSPKRLAKMYLKR